MPGVINAGQRPAVINADLRSAVIDADLRSAVIDADLRSAVIALKQKGVADFHEEGAVGLKKIDVLQA
jgi:hypothetical protein